jgi:hypothetical protein
VPTKPCPTCRGTGKIKVPDHKGIRFNGDPPQKFRPFMQVGVLTPTHLRVKDIPKLLKVVKRAEIAEELLHLEIEGMNRPGVVARISYRLGELES